MRGNGSEAAGVATAAGSGGTLHHPPYQAGPSGGDRFTLTNVDTKAGTVRVAQRNTRQAAFVHCVGNGPMAMLEVNHTVRNAISAVDIHYADAILTDALVMNAIVTGSSSGWLGHGATHGPKANGNERIGTIHVPLRTTPRSGETVRILFGLQTHAGCLPYPVLGLPGSRTVDKGSAAFPWVSVG